MRQNAQADENMRTGLRVWVYLLGAVAVFVLQIAVVWLRIYARDRMASQGLNNSFAAVLLVLLAGIVSGAILGLLLFSDASRKFPFWQAALLGVIPALAIIDTLLIVFGKQILPWVTSRPVVSSWVTGEVPPLWLGLVLGRILCDLVRLRNNQGAVSNLGQEVS